MKKWILAAFVIAAAVFAQTAAKYRTAPTGYSDTPMLPDGKWRVHDIARPKPAVVTPGAKPGDPPSDAIVLFDGTDLRHWNGDWLVKDGYVQVPARREKGKGLRTKESFGDVQLHIEWAAPTEIDGDSQWRGNSGVVLMGRYELQVLDSYNNPTYADGQAASVYGQFPPLVNASRKPGEWQTYDIVFEAPRFEGGYLTRPAYITVMHNGVLVQNHQQFIGQMAHRVIRQYEPHGPEAPLELQDHDTPVRYRNIWVRKLAPRQ